MGERDGKTKLNTEVSGQHGAATGGGTPGKATLSDGPVPLDQLVLVGDIRGGGNVGHVASSVQSNKDGSKFVELDAPHIHLEADASIPSKYSAENIAGPLSVGFIQELTSSDRTAVYQRRDGSTFEERILQQHKHDARWHDSTTPGVKVPDVGAGPWYETAASLSDSKRIATATLTDYPGFPADMKKNGGDLVRMKGADKFVSTVAVQRGAPAEPVTKFGSEAWEVPWNTEIEPGKTTFKTGDVAAKETKDQANVLSGDLPINAQSWIGYPTVDDAKHAPIDELLANLPAARDKDRPSYDNIVAAINALNWTFVVTLKCTNSYKWIGEDQVALGIKGTQGNRMATTFAMNTNTTRTKTFRFLEVCDPAKWNPGDKLAFEVTADLKDLDPVMLAPPFSALGSFTDVPKSNGRYQISVTRTP